MLTYVSIMIGKYPMCGDIETTGYEVNSHRRLGNKVNSEEVLLEKFTEENVLVLTYDFIMNEKSPTYGSLS